MADAEETPQQLDANETSREQARLLAGDPKDRDEMRVVREQIAELAPANEGDRLAIMDRAARLEALYEEIQAHYRDEDDGLVRRLVVPAALDSRVMLIGQALARDTQRVTGLPYCLPPVSRPRLSRGGQVLDAFLRHFDYTIDPHGDAQYAYHTDLAHFFPGRRQGGGDVVPSADEIERNRRWLEVELEVFEPSVVIPLGLPAARTFLERYGYGRVRKLGDVVATAISVEVHGRPVSVIPVHHPSGAFQHPTSSAAYETAAELVRQALV